METNLIIGMIKRDYKKGKEYYSIMWSRMNGFLKELGFAHMCAKDDFIQESIFYLLGMKASNDSARKFQMWLATEVIPSIRKHGAFIADSENVDEKYKKEGQRMNQKSIVIFKANKARELLHYGFKVVDIKPDKSDPDGKRSVFVFEYEDGILDKIKK